MDIRYLTEKDVKQYKALRLKSLQTDPKGFVSTYEREKTLSDEAFKKRIIVSETHFTIGTFDSGELICIATFYSEKMEKVKHKGNLVTVYCDPRYRHQGIAGQLIQHIIKDVSERGVVKIIGLSVLTENINAIRLYENLGFRRYGREPKSVFDGERYYDEDLMCLEI
ncbi:GNAT family N-acetyltransferase [Staphylococcus edaphicus]|uniref:GNAT family N-acetyltransferase n=1 Tax=Staphylococcus edaphicus TaxID=1955013 RepID=A0A2C6WLK2_9STAP|nr:N-acetyltransferase [Staphylococcus edaphicus]PHK48955.1 GNAT family N-acetyltransferase [Staphylococcus edaphicus]UQW81958.1 GNAT family N-acetyltransferase [Staphylococcus edaphicus]